MNLIMLTLLLCFGSGIRECSSDKKAAALIKKVVESAIANAENNQGADIDELKVKTIMVDEGPALKRFMARAKGRGTRILKRTSHITVVVGAGK